MLLQLTEQLQKRRAVKAADTGDRYKQRSSQCFDSEVWSAGCRGIETRFNELKRTYVLETNITYSLNPERVKTSLWLGEDRCQVREQAHSS